MGIEQLTWNTILETYWKLISCNFVTQILIFYYLVNCLCFYWNRKRPSKFQIRLNQEGNLSNVKGLHHQIDRFIDRKIDIRYQITFIVVTRYQITFIVITRYQITFIVVTRYQITFIVVTKYQITFIVVTKYQITYIVVTRY